MIPDDTFGRWDDPIVAEVRAIRERLVAEAGGTLDGLVALLQRSERATSRPVVTLPPRRPDDSDSGAAA